MVPALKVLLLGVSLRAEKELTPNVRISKVANLKAEFHEHLTRPGVKYDEEISILLENDLKMNKFHANVVSFDENVSYLSTSVN